MVEFYDPTDIFGDLAEALAESFPSISEDEDADDEDDTDEDGADDADDEDADDKTDAKDDTPHASPGSQPKK
jgi:hypothetical protein